jgi:hypothetical protein
MRKPGGDEQSETGLQEPAACLVGISGDAPPPVSRNASSSFFRPGNDHERIVGNGRWSFSASSVGAHQVSISSTVVRIAGMAFGWIAPTTLFGSVSKREVVGRLAFLYLSDGRPAGPDAGKERERSRLIESEPDRRTGAVGSNSFSEARERNRIGSPPQASVANAEI